mmetsp:Transcript_11459/g.22515  ORF Transcript_11459/g.22515 Transcript_11459/m.22515 type:complete len:162 (-) Transcript_11459:229-714(-)
MASARPWPLREVKSATSLSFLAREIGRYSATSGPFWWRLCPARRCIIAGMEAYSLLRTPQLKMENLGSWKRSISSTIYSPPVDRSRIRRLNSSSLGVAGWLEWPRHRRRLPPRGNRGGLATSSELAASYSDFSHVDCGLHKNAELVPKATKQLWLCLFLWR